MDIPNHTDKTWKKISCDTENVGFHDVSWWMEDRLICSSPVMTPHPLVGKRTEICVLPFGTKVNVVDTDRESALILLPDGQQGVISVGYLESRSSFKIVRPG